MPDLLCPKCKFFGTARVNYNAPTEELWWTCPMCKTDLDL